MAHNKWDFWSHEAFFNKSACAICENSTTAALKYPIYHVPSFLLSLSTIIPETSSVFLGSHLVSFILCDHSEAQLNS